MIILDNPRGGAALGATHLVVVSARLDSHDDVARLPDGRLGASCLAGGLLRPAVRLERFDWQTNERDEYEKHRSAAGAAHGGRRRAWRSELGISA